MDESALERFFDLFVANDSSEMKMEEDEEVNGELFLSLLPDELLTLYEDHTDGSTGLDYNSHNPSAAVVVQVPGGSSDRPVNPVNPVMPVTQQPEIIPQIHNVVSTVTLGCRLDLNSIACRAWNVEYNPKNYNSLIMRVREPRATTQIYTSGNLVCVGAKSVEQSRVAARKCARIVQKLGFPVRFLNFKIQNMVGSCSTFPLSLERLAQHQCCSYEPELFPGLHWKVLPGVTATISTSGKISVTGFIMSAAGLPHFLLHGVNTPAGSPGEQTGSSELTRPCGGDPSIWIKGLTEGPLLALTDPSKDHLQKQKSAQS